MGKNREECAWIRGIILEEKNMGGPCNMWTVEKRSGSVWAHTEEENKKQKRKGGNVRQKEREEKHGKTKRTHSNGHYQKMITEIAMDENV